jgi:hypothetical protein
MNERDMPWQIQGVPWKTESAFWGWVRGVLRKGWSRHPVKLEFIKQHRKRIINPKQGSRNKVEIWGMNCAVCNIDHPQADIEIDHKNAASSLRNIDDLKGFAERLFVVNFDDLRPVCKPCHKIISYSQKQGISFEEATIEKEVIAICKLSATEQHHWIMENSNDVCPPKMNAKERRVKIKQLLVKRLSNC